MTVVMAKFEDLSKVLELALMVPKEHDFEKLPEVNVDKVKSWILEKWLKSPIFVFKDVDGNILGILGTMLNTFWWSNSPILTDYILFVKPEGRSLGATKELLKAFKEFADKHGLPIMSNILSSKRTQSKARFFRTNGFRESGFIATRGI